MALDARRSPRPHTPKAVSWLALAGAHERVQRLRRARGAPLQASSTCAVTWKAEEATAQEMPALSAASLDQMLAADQTETAAQVVTADEFVLNTMRDARTALLAQLPFQAEARSQAAARAVTLAIGSHGAVCIDPAVHANEPTGERVQTDPLAASASRVVASHTPSRDRLAPSSPVADVDDEDSASNASSLEPGHWVDEQIARALLRWRRHAMLEWRAALQDAAQQQHRRRKAYTRCLRRLEAHLHSMLEERSRRTSCAGVSRQGSLRRACASWRVEATWLRRYYRACRARSRCDALRAFRIWHARPRASRRIVGLSDVRRQIVSLLAQ